MLAKRFDAAREIHSHYEGLFVPQPKRAYTLQFSEQPIRGIESLERLRPKPEIQLHDRPFGGNMEFLETDVSTGNRGAGIGSEAGKAIRHTEFSALCDEYGIHLFFSAFDDKAREVEAKLAGAGGYEMYLAPGPNQPYTCFLPDLQYGTNHIWHTTYNNEYHRRIRPDSKDTRFEHVFHDQGYKSHLFISREVLYDKLPGDIWEFDNLHWKREGGFSWSGSKGIHSRSSWGHLKFNISAASGFFVGSPQLLCSSISFRALGSSPAQGLGGFAPRPPGFTALQPPQPMLQSPCR